MSFVELYVSLGGNSGSIQRNGGEPWGPMLPVNGRDTNLRRRVRSYFLGSRTPFHKEKSFRMQPCALSPLYLQISLEGTCFLLREELLKFLSFYVIFCLHRSWWSLARLIHSFIWRFLLRVYYVPGFA